MNNKPLISVIVTTKNEEQNIFACLKSIKEQSYKNIEIIVVDNNSKDKTVFISKKFTNKVYKKGPERSSQRNYAVKKAIGKYVLFIDADMLLGKNVAEECVMKFENNSNIGALVVPERSIGNSFWAKCKGLEKRFYEGVFWMEAARFYRKKILDEIGGFDQRLISGEDWDLSERVGVKFKIKRIQSYVSHNEGNISLTKILKKKYYYSKHISKYAIKSRNELNIMVLNRYMLFFSNPKLLFDNPILGVGMLLMKTLEFSAGAIGYLINRKIF